MFIQQADLFKDLGSETMTEIAKVMVEVSYSANDVLFTPSDRADFFYILVEGRIRLIIGEGAELNYPLSVPGEAFGWSGLVGRTNYIAKAECEAPSKVVKIDKNRINEVLEKNPVDGAAFFKRLGAAVTQRLIWSYDAFGSAQGREKEASYGTGQVTTSSED
jgi:CRP-like cAMP-binding protein